MEYTVLLTVSSGYSVEKGTFPRVTHPSAAHPEGCARLACIRPAASVRSEPGSNSQVESISLCCPWRSNLCTSLDWLFKPIKTVCCISIKRYRKPTNSEADTTLSDLHPSSAICKGWSIDQRTKLPAYLFSVSSMSNIVPDKKNDCAKIIRHQTAPLIQF